MDEQTFSPRTTRCAHASTAARPHRHARDRPDRARVDLARRRSRPRAVLIRSRQPVCGRAAPRHRRRRRLRRARLGARSRRGLVRGHGPRQRQIGHDRDRGRVVGHAHASRPARCEEGHRGCRGRSRRHSRGRRRRRAVPPARHPQDGRPAGLRRPARVPASASARADRRGRARGPRPCRCRARLGCRRRSRRTGGGRAAAGRDAGSRSRGPAAGGDDDAFRRRAGRGRAAAFAADARDAARFYGCARGGCHLGAGRRPSARGRSCSRGGCRPSCGSCLCPYRDCLRSHRHCTRHCGIRLFGGACLRPCGTRLFGPCLRASSACLPHFRACLQAGSGCARATPDGVACRARAYASCRALRCARRAARRRSLTTAGRARTRRPGNARKPADRSRRTADEPRRAEPCACGAPRHAPAFDERARRRCRRRGRGSPRRPRRAPCRRTQSDASARPPASRQRSRGTGQLHSSRCATT